MTVKRIKIGGASATAQEIQDARVPALAGNGGKVLAVNSSATGMEWVNQSSGSVTDVTVGGTSVVSNGVAQVPSIPDVSTKLDKVTYEWNKEIAFGSSGYLLIGKFPMYDSNVTIEIDSTTSTTYHGVLVLATQNINTSRGGSYVANVYGDAANTVAPTFKIQYSSGSRNFNIYFQPPAWSKNLVHIKAVALNSAPTESEICTSVSSVPTTDLITVTNVLTSTFAAQSAIPTVPTISTNVVTDKASDTKTSSPKSVYNEIHPTVGSSQPSGGMLPNVFYNLGTLTGSVTISLAAASDSNIENEYMFQFATSSTAPTITWPAAITAWFGGSAPTINASKSYQVSVVNGLGICAEF